MNTRTMVMSGVLVVLAGFSYWLGRNALLEQHPVLTSEPERKVLYWYDPMSPGQHFDKPGKSPFMDMQLVPRYAEDTNSVSANAVRVDSQLAQNLGVRVATVERGVMKASLDTNGTIGFNQRDVSVVQSRTNGFVSRAYAHAPGDVIKQDEALADIVVPEWASAQGEYLALLKSGDAMLIDAARSRLHLLGMPDEVIAQMQSTLQVSNVVTIRAPRSGMINTLDIREGMAVSIGAPIASIYGLQTVWLEAAVPESQTSRIVLHHTVTAEVIAYPAAVFKGRITAILPDTSADTHTVRVRVDLNNSSALLKPGMFARVHLGEGDQNASLQVPSEAVIHTGERTVVLVMNEPGRYVPVEVQTGVEANGKTAILNGLQEGQRVVASGQFLIDSEANLNGAFNRMQSMSSHDQHQGSTP